MRLLIVSNRLPVTVEKKGKKFKIKQSVGGLVSGINDYLNMIEYSDFLKFDHLWIGSSGIDTESKNKEELTKIFLNEYSCQPIYLPEEVMEKFYYGFCNKALWPLFHSFPSYVEYNDEYWQIYQEVNFIFTQQILKVIKPEDMVWVHDYHLMLLPQMLRNEIPQAKIAFFLHIPFPNIDIFSILPKKWCNEILQGMLGSDVVGFHIDEYLRNFLHCAKHFLGYKYKKGKILIPDRLVKAGSFPIGINFQKYFEALKNKNIVDKVKKLKQNLKNYKVLLSIDRLDYSKGIVNRLKGYELFLEHNPQYWEKVVLVMVIVPSRVGIEQYQRTEKQIDELIGRINGRFGNVNWIPILFQTSFLPFEDLVSYYNIADIAFIVPLRDGMNLIAKEYIASRADGTGVLILSELAGASKELTKAILVNPYNISAIVSSIKEALEMPVEEQISRNRKMQEVLKRNHIGKWGNDMIKELLPIKE
jgi:trehalose 6-phosphate synthase/phosphatase